MIRLDIAIELEYLVIEPSEFIFKIMAADTLCQKVGLRHMNLPPGTPFTIEGCRSFGNQHLRLHAEPGPLRIQYAALVDINPYLVVPNTLSETPVARLPVDVLEYLCPSRYCPSDRFQEIALQAFGKLEQGYSRVQAICDWVRNRTRFQPGTTTPSHCAMDTYNDRVGVCRDFAHLTIALCRALSIPARYVTSVDYGADAAAGPPDFHSYVEAYLSDRWFIFDPTGLCPSNGLIRIATGRDASDVAFTTFFGRATWPGMPKVSVSAHDNPAAGIVQPSHTGLAVSTSDSVNTRTSAEYACPEPRSLQRHGAPRPAIANSPGQHMGGARRPVHERMAGKEEAVKQ